MLQGVSVFFITPRPTSLHFSALLAGKEFEGSVTIASIGTSSVDATYFQ